MGTLLEIVLNVPIPGQARPTMRLPEFLFLVFVSAEGLNARVSSRSSKMSLSAHRAVQVNMLLELPRSAMRVQPAQGKRAQQLSDVDFNMEAIHFTKRRVCGGVSVRASEAEL